MAVGSRHPAARRRTGRDALAWLAGWQAWLEDTGLPSTVTDLEQRCAEPDPPSAAVWADYERHGARYLALLDRIVPGARDEAAFGGLAAELAERVAAHPLDTSLLHVELRGYQGFGARFVLNQGRVLLGDEMGLGKTVQAIAVMADRAAAGDTHFLVVCPASVLVGWQREVATHSRLVAAPAARRGDRDEARGALAGRRRRRHHDLRGS